MGKLINQPIPVINLKFLTFLLCLYHLCNNVQLGIINKVLKVEKTTPEINEGSIFGVKEFMVPSNPMSRDFNALADRMAL